MKTLTKNTLSQVASRELGIDPYEAIDSADKIGTQKAKTYLASLNNIDYIVDEAKDSAINTLTGEKIDVATFLFALRKAQAKDTTFQSNPQMLDMHEFSELINHIQTVQDYMVEEVARDTEGKDGIVSRTFKVIFFEESMLVVEQTATCNGADLLHFREPQLKLYDTLSNAHLYYTDDKESVLHFLGFTSLDSYTWYRSDDEIIAHIGEYNFFKKGKGISPANTKTDRVNNLLNFL